MNQTQEVHVIESRIFTSDVQKLLSETERMALCALLATNPFAGQALTEEKEGSYLLSWNETVEVIYILSRDLDKIYLISIQSTKDIEYGQEKDKKQLVAIWRRLREAGIGWAIREIYDFIVDNLSKM